jgi:hypothetical protein
MKKSNVFLVMVCLVGLWATSCVKDNDIVNTNEKNVDRSTTAQLLKQLKPVPLKVCMLYLIK